MITNENFTTPRESITFLIYQQQQNIQHRKWGLFIRILSSETASSLEEN